jgi:hypothetical protein
MATRRVAIFAFLALLPARSLVMADEQGDARAIVERAVEAAGGRAALSRYKKPLLRVSEGMLPGRQGLPTAFEIKEITLLPDKIRTDQRMASEDKYSTVFDGDKGWRTSTGLSTGPSGERVVTPPKVREMNAREIQRTRYVRLYAAWIVTLLRCLTRMASR